MHVYFVRFVRSTPAVDRAHINYSMESSSRESLRRRVKELAKTNGAYEIAIYTEKGRMNGERPIEEWILGENRWKRIR
ncbi:MAG: hypothetical protein IIY21_06300 [Clostridiales bacterium]|nr:hypothetical protein [Clostridiales bacterium]